MLFKDFKNNTHPVTMQMPHARMVLVTEHDMQDSEGRNEGSISVEVLAGIVAATGYATFDALVPVISSLWHFCMAPKHEAENQSSPGKPLCRNAQLSGCRLERMRSKAASNRYISAMPQNVSQRESALPKAGMHAMQSHQDCGEPSADSGPYVFCSKRNQQVYLNLQEGRVHGSEGEQVEDSL
jgi:hypothetical protein